MEWQQLIGFYHVAKLGSFTRAAGVTFRTQSALTQQIKSLEEELGCQLFERIGKRKLLLTTYGEKLFAFSETVLSKYQYLIEDLSELKGIQKGQLKIAAPYTTLYHLLPKVLEAYIQQFPWVELSLLDRSQQNVVELVRNGDIDFGITLESMVHKNLEKMVWKKVEVVLLTPVGHPLAGIKKVAVQQIAQFPLILPPKGIANRRKLEELFEKHKLEYRIVMESSNVELSSLYVEMGLGISFATVAKDLPLQKQRKLEFVPLNHYFPPEYITVLYRRDKAMSPYKKAFLKIILDN